MNIAWPRAILAVTVLAFASLPSLAAISLCRHSERTYFSCAVKSGKIASLCGNAYVEDANQLIEQETSWLQYRFGLPGHVELSYPSVRKDSVSKFYGEIFRAQGGSIGADSIMFVSGGIGYRVEYVFPEGGGAYHQVQVGDPKKLDINLPVKRKTAYPEVDIHCVPPVAAQKLNELARFLMDQNGKPDSK